MVERVFEDAGEPTDLWIYSTGTTFDLTVAGSVKILALLNRAYQRITNWKLPNDRVIRFTTCNKKLSFVANEVAVTVTETATPTIVTFDSGGMAIDGKYVLWVLEIGSERRLITGYTGATAQATIHRRFTTAPSSSAGILYKKVFNFDVFNAAVHHVGEIIPVALQNEVQAVQSVLDVTNETPLDKVKREDGTWAQLFDGQTTVGQYQQTGDGIEFDQVPEDGTVFLLRYYGLPEVLTVATQIPKIPDAWHDVIVMLASWYRMKTDRETDDAYALKRDIDDAIVRIVQPMERAFDFEEGALYIGEGN